MNEAKKVLDKGEDREAGGRGVPNNTGDNDNDDNMISENGSYQL